MFFNFSRQIRNTNQKMFKSSKMTDLCESDFMVKNENEKIIGKNDVWPVWQLQFCRTAETS